MWTSTNFKTYKKQFDFSSSEQGKPILTVLKVDDKDFINMVEGLEGEIEENQIFQTIICDHCGTYHCESGNWVAVRQLDNFVFFIPAFGELIDDDRAEYEPPFSLRQKGAYWLKSIDFENFKKLVPELAKQNSINQLTNFELKSLYKWDTPHKMFGDFPDFGELKKNHVLVTSELDNETIFAIIEQQMSRFDNAVGFKIEPLDDTDKVISIFLNDSATTEWRAIYQTDNIYGLLLGGTFKIEITDE